MGAFDTLDKREEKIKVTIEVDDILYGKLSQLSKNTYDASVNKLINLAIAELLKTENINLYKNSSKLFSVKHSLLIKKSLLQGLEKLKIKYDISLYKLVNMSINNALTELENKDKS